MSVPETYTDILRRLTPEQKLAISQQLRETAWALTAAGVRGRHPGLPEREVQSRVRAIFLDVVT